MQLQMPVCKLSKTDFFIFSSANGGSSSPYAQVPIGNQFLQCETFPKVLRYFQNILLPEIMTRKLEPDFENCHCQGLALDKLLVAITQIVKKSSCTSNV